MNHPDPDLLSTAKEYEKELTRIFDRFNHHYWNDELPDVIITFVPTKRAYGHLSSAPVWHAKDKESKYELNISAYTISRPPEEICSTLLHEQVHLYCAINKIKDTSNNHRYHNKRFKQIAEDHGLIISYASSIGWSPSKLNEEAKAYVKKLNIKQFSYHKNIDKRGGNLMRFSCPRCRKPAVYAASDQNVLCGFCGTKLEYMPSPIFPAEFLS